MDFFAAADLDSLLSAFGEPVTLDDGSASGYACAAIFDAAFRLVDLSGIGAESYAPALTAKSSDVSAAEIAQGGSVTVAGRIYSVAQVQPERPDGKGMTVLILTDYEDAY